MEYIKISYQELHELMQQSKTRKVEDVLELLDHEHGVKSSSIFPNIKDKLKKFVNKYNARLQEFNRMYERLGATDWIQEGYIEVGNHPTTSKRKPEPKEFTLCCEKTKKKRSMELMETEEVSADLIKYTAEELRKEEEGDIKAALAFFMDMKLSVYQWQKLKEYHEKYNYFPSYRKLLEEKKKCYPEDVEVTEKSASVKLQSLLDHTANRILESQSIDHLQAYAEKEMLLISKWGMDGSSGHSQYKQNFTDNTATDSSLFSISMVPLVLSCNKEQVWENPTPSSTRYCRPIKFEYAKETGEYTKQQDDLMKEQINSIHETIINISGLQFKVEHKLEETMVDGKVCNSLSDNKSAATCYICHAKPSEMNQLDRIVKRTPNQEAYRFGLSTLHCRIRFMETLLNIAYQITVRKAGETKRTKLSEDEKIIRDQRKKEVQQNLKDQLQITVDVVKQGSGTTNDGNTARKFFSDPEKTALATGVDTELIRRFSSILQAITSGYKIDCDKFSKYGKETAGLYVKKYSWHYMPPTVHKVLIHGAEIIRSFLVPIGQLSEEALEAGNKDFRNTRLYHARKTSRKDNCEDILHYLLANSDPAITSRRILKEKKHLELSEEAMNLLVDD